MSQMERLIKLAQISPDIEITGRNIADIIRFIIRKIPYEKRQFALMKIRNKLWKLNEYDIAAKKAPDTATIGQAITFIKTLLNGKPAGYIRSVLSEVVKRL